MYMTKRNKRGLVDGAEGGRIERLKINGFMKYLLTLVSFQPMICVEIHRLTLQLLAHDFDPATNARKERKERISKNQKQQDRNKAHAETSDRQSHKQKLEKDLLTTRISTASMGK